MGIVSIANRRVRLMGVSVPSLHRDTGKIVINTGLNGHRITLKTSVFAPSAHHASATTQLPTTVLVSVQCTCTLYCHAQYAGSSALFISLIFPTTDLHGDFFRYITWPTNVSIHDKTLKGGKIHRCSDMRDFAKTPFCSSSSVNRHNSKLA